MLKHPLCRVSAARSIRVPDSQKVFAASEEIVVLETARQRAESITRCESPLLTGFFQVDERGDQRGKDFARTGINTDLHTLIR